MNQTTSEAETMHDRPGASYKHVELLLFMERTSSKVRTFCLLAHVLPKS